jgi:small subunit ribosomal protein S11
MATPRPATIFPSFVCRSCRHHLFARPRPRPRHFTAAATLRAGESNNIDSAFTTFLNTERANTQRRPARPWTRPRTDSNTPASISALLDAAPDYSSSLLGSDYAETLSKAPDPPHRLHVFAHKHNTHITFVQPPKPLSQTPHLATATASSKTTASQQTKEISVLLSLSTGNIGFKKAGRGSYDAAFQLAAFALKQIQEKGMWRDVKELEVVLRGFGAGREAVTKALLGTEGRFLRARITSVADATRLKQGGGRAKKPRRLG